MYGVMKLPNMNREELLNQMLNTIHHYAQQEPEANIYNLAIQVATQMAKEDDKEQVVAALLLSLKHLDKK